ncbi:MAG: nitronate monooxygenase [Chitinophagales bacterium]
MDNRITQLFGIKYPIIQAGMIWVSGWKLASAISEAGGLGIIGSASMYPDVLREHLQKMKKATQKPFAVNVPLLYPDINELMEIIIEEKVPIVFTSAGNPKVWTAHLKKHGIKVVHVVSSVKFAKKCEEVGVDAIVAEGFEAGGHNGREETTTMCLIPEVREAIDIPLIAAGGIGSGKAMLAAFALGAEAVQIGTAFVATEESSAHQAFKQSVVDATEGATKLTMKKVVPVRLIKNKFYNAVQEAEDRGASQEELAQLLGRARAKKGMFLGDLDEGELEIGQIASMVKRIRPAQEVFFEIWNEFKAEQERIAELELE